MTVRGATNVLSSRFGSGSVNGLGRELGRFIVTTMDVPWRIAAERVGGKPAAVLIADSMEVDRIDSQEAAAPECDTVLAAGGGRAVDLGKYIAWKRGCRLVTVPTVLSVDAFVTPAAGVRRNHRVEYVGSASPDPLVIDYDLLRTAPPELNIAGVGDLLSIHTAAFDWELAHRAGKTEFAFSVDAVQSARSILDTISIQRDEIRDCSDVGLRTIVEGYMAVNAICLPAGHYRVEEGSEHYLFYELEERLKRPFIHGQIIGLGIYIMSRLQENDPVEITSLMNQLGLNYNPMTMGIGSNDLTESLISLRSYVETNSLWYTVINEKPISRAWAEAVVESVVAESAS